MHFLDVNTKAHDVFLFSTKQPIHSMIHQIHVLKISWYKSLKKINITMEIELLSQQVVVSTGRACVILTNTPLVSLLGTPR